MKQLLQSGQSICLLLFLLVSALTGQTQVIVQLDSEQVSNSQAARRGIYRLKAALAKPAGSIDETDSLLTLARQFGSPSAQVVALCQLASLRLQQQQNQQAATLMQDANRLTAQLRDLKDVGWTLGQVARIQANTMRTAPSSATMFSPLLESLGKSMATSALSRGRSRDDISFTFDGPTPVPPDRRTTDRRTPPEPPVEYNITIPNPATDPNWIRRFRIKPDFVDRWLDTIIRFDKGNPQIVKQLTVRKKLRDSSQALSSAFAKEGDYAKAYQYFLQYTAYKDSLTAEATSRRLASLAYKQNLLKKESQIQLLTKDRQLREQEANRQRQYVLVLIGCIALLGAFLFALSRNNRAKQLANQQLNEQKEALQTTLAQLKTTQAQLIQSEKMASLGELTAGIAHEIQNPLNFVNNFSEVSTELVTELIDHRAEPHRDEELENELLADVQQNLQKISEHGNRASAIIKGMLEHARTTGGQKEPTELNALVDEYAKLAFHSLQAKDKSTDIKLVMNFAPTLSQVLVSQQEVGRVILNIVNNAFYAVQKRQREGEIGYQPEVVVSTYQEASQVWVTIRDNGTGMSDAVKAKIFQPFFTTKPAGQGTGLGLSISYDIITKGHGGSLTIVSEEGQFTEFTIKLPTVA
ncbi:sensor histidine kinase [Fibrella forsythiae]|uniref:histidine kinase n=1 Tax=Fibrella forsythiae TaxID=2817061 RepID=A0ABS3JIT1_9BACT|nr:ATP-binding protein [Fibrella forsythiae]MBO0949318.1 two-component sensor histidine kinase [Fibrella forsythiae]